jgi:glycosyltransferase involved in cell wall biosynthesis
MDEPSLATEPITLSVVIPALNEEVAISGILQRVLALRAPLAQAGIGGPEVIVVDDGSRDRTGEIVKEFTDVSMIRHGENRGYGAALKTGLARARGELIGFVDADGTYPPELFPRLCAVALDGADVVIGSRMTGTPTQMPLTRRAPGDVAWLARGARLRQRHARHPPQRSFSPLSVARWAQLHSDHEPARAARGVAIGRSADSL